MSKKKKVFATSAAAVLAASAVTPAVTFAAEKTFPDVKDDAWYADAVNALLESGVIQGDQNGNFNPDKELTRAEGAEFLYKALGLSAEGTEDYPDVEEDHWFYDAVVATTAAGIFEGNDAGEFMPKDELDRQQAAVALVRAFGLEGSADLSFEDADDIASWAKDAVAAAVENGVIEGKPGNKFAPTDTITRAEFAVMVKRAMDAVAAPEVVSVTAVSAKTLKVTFNKPVDDTKAEFEVKRGSVKPSVKEIKFAEDKKSATIEFTTPMIAGDYTVSVVGLTDEALTGSVKVEAEKLVEISFVSDIAVIDGDNVVAKVIAKNQYGEDVTTKLNTSNSNIQATTSKGTGVTIDNKGNLTVKGSSGLFKVGDKVVVTIVDSSTGVNATKTLTVAQAAQVDSIELGELTTDDEDLAKERVNVANMTEKYGKYYIPVTIKDQYGNVLSATDLVGVQIFTSNANIINPKGFKDTKNGTVIELQKPTDPTHGTAVLTVVASGTGKSANVSVKVEENSKLDVVSIEAPSTELKLTKATELPISIVNTYGEDVALKDVNVTGSGTELILDGNTRISAIGATLSVERDYVNDKAVLKITPNQKNITITVVTATGKTQVLNLTAFDAPVVSGIAGLDSNFVSVLANDTDLSTDLKAAVKFVDQYGDPIAAPDFDNANDDEGIDFEIKEKDSNNGVTTYANGVITASTTAGTETYEILLKNDGKVLDSREVTITVVDLKDIDEFAIDDLNKFYTGGTDSAYDQQVKVHGIYNGKKVLVDQEVVKDVSATGGLDISTDGSYSAKVISTNGKDVDSTITVIVETPDDTYILTKDVVYSDAAPEAVSLTVMNGNSKVTSGVVSLPADQVNDKKFVPDSSDTELSSLRVIAKDQYGVELSSGYKVVITNENKAGSQFAAGDSFQLNVRHGKLMTSIKVFVE